MAMLKKLESWYIGKRNDQGESRISKGDNDDNVTMIDRVRVDANHQGKSFFLLTFPQRLLVTWLLRNCNLPYNIDAVVLKRYFMRRTMVDDLYDKFSKPSMHAVLDSAKSRSQVVHLKMNEKKWDKVYHTTMFALIKTDSVKTPLLKWLRDNVPLTVYDIEDNMYFMYRQIADVYAQSKLVYAPRNSLDLYVDGRSIYIIDYGSFYAVGQRSACSVHYPFANQFDEITSRIYHSEGFDVDEVHEMRAVWSLVVFHDDLTNKFRFAPGYFYKSFQENAQKLKTILGETHFQAVFGRNSNRNCIERMAYYIKEIVLEVHDKIRSDESLELGTFPPRFNFDKIPIPRMNVTVDTSPLLHNFDMIGFDDSLLTVPEEPVEEYTEDDDMTDESFYDLLNITDDMESLSLNDTEAAQQPVIPTPSPQAEKGFDEGWDALHVAEVVDEEEYDDNNGYGDYEEEDFNEDEVEAINEASVHSETRAPPVSTEQEEHSNPPVESSFYTAPVMPEESTQPPIPDDGGFSFNEDDVQPITTTSPVRPPVANPQVTMEDEVQQPVQSIIEDTTPAPAEGTMENATAQESSEFNDSAMNILEKERFVRRQLQQVVNELEQVTRGMPQPVLDNGTKIFSQYFNAMPWRPFIFPKGVPLWKGTQALVKILPQDRDRLEQFVNLPMFNAIRIQGPVSHLSYGASNAITLEAKNRMRELNHRIAHFMYMHEGKTSAQPLSDDENKQLIHMVQLYYKFAQLYVFYYKFTAAANTAKNDKQKRDERDQPNEGDEEGRNRQRARLGAKRVYNL